MSPAPVHNGLTGGHDAIVNDYYRFSHRETVGPAQIETEASTRAFTALDELIDHMIASPEQTQVVVNHGSPTQGLLIRFTATSPHNATGLVMQELSALVEAVARGTLLNPTDSRLVNIASQMGIGANAALQLLGKFVQVRQRSLTLHLRGCNLGGNTTLLNAYKLAFGALTLTAPRCRMFYLRIRPQRPGAGTSVAQLAAQTPTTPKTRRRLFTTPSGSVVGPLLVDVQDIDGHTKVHSPHSWLGIRAEAPTWGALLTGQWTNTAREFVLPVFWHNQEKSFHTPLEVGYRQRLSFV